MEGVAARAEAIALPAVWGAVLPAPLAEFAGVVGAALARPAAVSASALAWDEVCGRLIVLTDPAVLP